MKLNPPEIKVAKRSDVLSVTPQPHVAGPPGLEPGLSVP